MMPNTADIAAQAGDTALRVMALEIAKIIDPHSFLPIESKEDWEEDMVRSSQELALSKATRILAAIEPQAVAEPVAFEWCAYEDGYQKTSWCPEGYGDRAGWEAIRKRHPETYEIKTRALYTRPAPAPALEKAIEAAARVITANEYGLADEEPDYRRDDWVNENWPKRAKYAREILAAAGVGTQGDHSENFGKHVYGTGKEFSDAREQSVAATITASDERAGHDVAERLRLWIWEQIEKHGDDLVASKPVLDLVLNKIDEFSATAALAAAPKAQPVQGWQDSKDTRIAALESTIDALHGPLSIAALEARAGEALASLEAAVVALTHSRPLMHHYPEARERHQNALKTGRDTIARLRSAAPLPAGPSSKDGDAEK